MSVSELLGYIADYTRQAVAAGTVTLPAARPVHAGLSRGELLGYIADSTQDAS